MKWIVKKNNAFPVEKRSYSYYNENIIGIKKFNSIVLKDIFYKRRHKMDKTRMMRAGMQTLLQDFKNVSGSKCLILITRKGYWLYRSMKDSIEYQSLFDGINDTEVYTDRYMTKATDYSFVEGKQVYVFDDAVLKGSSLLRIFFELSKYRVESIKCYTIALSTEYSNKFTKKIFSEYKQKFEIYKTTHTTKENLIDTWQNFDELIENFKENFYYKIQYSPENMSEFFFAELNFFQKNLAPLVMDLPLLKSSESGKCGFTSARIRMKESEFEKLKKGNYEWNYVTNEYRVKDISDQRRFFRIGCDFFQYDGRICKDNLGKLFLDFVVKVKYNKIKTNEGESESELVFTPFAFINSWDLKTVEVCFELFFEKTSYGKKILQSLENEDDREKIEKIYNNMYRAIIYYMSCYIGIKFCEYIKVTINKEVRLFPDALSENNTVHFYQEMESLFDDFDEVEAANQWLKLREYTAVNSKTDLKTDIISKSSMDDISRSVYVCIYQWILEKKWEEDVLYLEDIISAVQKIFDINNVEKCKTIVTTVIITMLECTVVGNKIEIDWDNHVMHRGIRYGEMIDMLLLQGTEYVYAYVYAFFLKTQEKSKFQKNESESYYCDYYDKFSKLLKSYFERKQYVGRIIPKNTFEFLMYYYGKLKERKGDIRTQIMRKRFLLSQDDSVISNGLNQLFLHEAFEWVEQIAFWEE